MGINDLWLSDMSKRLIFSLYTDKVDPHTSATDQKKQSFAEYKDRIKTVQQDYAKICNADYILFNTTNTSYIDIQFEKLFKLEEMVQEYDEVLYLDFDVIPYTKVNFFDMFDLDTLCVYSSPTELLKKPEWHPMDPYVKMSCKKAMLLIEDIVGTSEIFNTGVTALNKRSASLLRFKDRFTEYKESFKLAQEDNLYPFEMSSIWQLNNEVYASYIVEKYNIPTTNIGMPWNFIVDYGMPIPSAGAYFHHCVNKNFSTLPQFY
jgi:hypothetical protein